MGKYFNGSSEDKGQELVLNHGAMHVTPEYAASCVNNEKLIPVCVVDNGRFEAAALIYNVSELIEFAQPDDFRPKRWYLIDREIAKNIFH